MKAETEAMTAFVPVTRRKLDRDDLLMRLGVCLLIAWMVVTLVLPLALLLAKSFENQSSEFVGLDNYIRYLSTPSSLRPVWNSLFVAVVTTGIVLPLTFVYGYALQRSCMKWKGVFRGLALVPILTPSMLPAISLIYLFGKQGFFQGLLLGGSIYGPGGIVLAQVFYCFPHALMIMLAALSMSDARLYEAADALGASKTRIFLTVTLPGVKYGLISAGFVVFTLVVTDFGIASVIGGRYNVLATDIFRQVIGQQNFGMAAVVGFMLLVPAGLAFVFERIVSRRQVTMVSARAVPLEPRPQVRRDWLLFLYCGIIGMLILSVLGMSVWASFVTSWPYNLALTLKNFAFGDYDANGWNAYWNSLRLSAWTAAIGSTLVFVGAFLVEKTRGFFFWRNTAHFMAMLPLAVPGLALGLSYIFFFNAKGNPLGFVYGTMIILVMNSITHFYTVCHLTAVTALRQLDSEFEAVSASLRVSLLRTMVRVTIPICLPALLDIGIYMFVNAMATISSVIFLYSTSTRVASIAIIDMNDFGFAGAAAAMAIVITATSAAVKLIQTLLTTRLQRATQAWRTR